MRSIFSSYKYIIIWLKCGNVKLIRNVLQKDNINIIWNYNTKKKITVVLQVLQIEWWRPRMHFYRDEFRRICPQSQYWPFLFKTKWASSWQLIWELLYHIKLSQWLDEFISVKSYPSHGALLYLTTPSAKLKNRLLSISPLTENYHRINKTQSAISGRTNATHFFLEETVYHYSSDTKSLNTWKGPAVDEIEPLPTDKLLHQKNTILVVCVTAGL